MSKEEAYKVALRKEADLERNRIEAEIWKIIPKGSDYMTAAAALMSVLSAVIRWEADANVAEKVRATTVEDHFDGFDGLSLCPRCGGAQTRDGALCLVCQNELRDDKG